MLTRIPVSLRMGTAGRRCPARRAMPCSSDAEGLEDLPPLGMIKESGCVVLLCSVLPNSNRAGVHPQAVSGFAETEQQTSTRIPSGMNGRKLLGNCDKRAV